MSWWLLSDAVCIPCPRVPFSYCSQMLSKEVDACVTGLLKELVRFQDRMYQTDPVKAKTKRRLVLGLREVLKHLKLRKLKCIIISPNCEKTQSKGDSPADPQPVMHMVGGHLGSLLSVSTEKSLSSVLPPEPYLTLTLTFLTKGLPLRPTSSSSSDDRVG